MSLPREAIFRDWVTIIKVARPGFWTTHLWFYLLPLGGTERFTHPPFWAGAFYVMAPMGLLLYGWNDVVDRETDRLNPRKGTFLFGANCSAAELQRLPRMIFAVQLPFVLLFIYLLGWRGVYWFAGACAINTLYNSPPFGWKNLPGLDLISQVGYLLVFLLSSWLNDVPQLPPAAWVFGLLFAMHSHLTGQIMDVIPDKTAGRHTTAVTIGIRNSKLLLALFLGAESLLLHFWFLSPVAALFLGGAGLAFLYDGLFRNDQLPSTGQMRFLLLAWNAVALTSMWWVWATGLFVR